MTIRSKARDGSDLDISAKQIDGVELPRNMLTDPDGNELKPLTDDDLRAQPVDVSVDSLPLPEGAATQATLAALLGAAATDATLAAGVSALLTALGGLLTDAQLRAAPLPVSFNWDGMTNAQLRAAPVAVSAEALPLPAGAASESSVATIASVVKAEDSAGADGHPGIVILVQRRDSDTVAVDADGDYTTLKTDEAGRLKVATQPASYAATTGNITANGQTVFVNCERFSNLMVHCKGVFSAVNVAFEGSLDSTNGADGTWFGLQAIRSNANTIETATGNLSAAPAYAWELSANGLKWFRVRATAYGSGTQTWTMVPGTYATEPIPGAQISGTQPVSGTVALGAATTRVGFVAQAGIWYDDTVTALAAAGTFTGNSRDATVTATATAMANAATYAQEIRLSAESDQAGTLWLEVSRDNVNWRRAKVAPTAAVSGGGQYAEIVHRPSWRYWRVGFTNGAAAQARLAVGSIALA